MKRIKRLVGLVGLIGWRTWAWIAIGTAIMMVIVVHVVLGTLLHIGIATTRAVEAISTITNINIPVDILHTNFDVSTSNGVIDMDIPEDAGIGQWRILNSYDLVNWRPVASMYTDRKSASILMWALYSAHTNITGCSEPMLFYKAVKDDYP